MFVLQYIFWISFALLFYNYAGYAIIAYLFTRLRKSKDIPQASLKKSHSVSFIVAAFNEEDCIAEKVANSLQQNYPRDLIEFIFITDGSTDQTVDILRKFEGINLLHNDLRKGKSAALNRAVENAKNEILIFSDANTTLNIDAVSRISSHYQNEKVGGVAGEKKIINDLNNEDAAESEGLYWKYESSLKKIDSDFYTVVGAAGELFSLRKNLYAPVNDKVILDDFIISMNVAEQGYKVVYEPQAFAMESPSFSIKDEQKRKIRIAAGGFQALAILTSLLQVWKQPKLSFLYISHRVMRWTTSPISLILIFISNGILAINENFTFIILFLFQISFYLMAFLSNFINFKIFRVAYYFLFMNISVIRGYFRFMQGNQPAAWEKVKRTRQGIDNLVEDSMQKY